MSDRLSVLVAFLLAGCSGCDYRFATIPRQDEAMALVWEQMFKASYDYPHVKWITQESLDCDPDDAGRNHAFMRGNWFGDDHKVKCVGGVTFSDWNVCEVALADGDTFSNSAFSHELLHQDLYDELGDADPGHTNPGFGIAFGHDRGIVDDAVDLLKDRGL